MNGHLQLGLTIPISTIQFITRISKLILLLGETGKKKKKI